MDPRFPFASIHSLSARQRSQMRRWQTMHSRRSFSRTKWSRDSAHGTRSAIAALSVLTDTQIVDRRQVEGAQRFVERDLGGSEHVCPHLLGVSEFPCAGYLAELGI